MEQALGVRNNLKLYIGFSTFRFEDRTYYSLVNTMLCALYPCQIHIAIQKLLRGQVVATLNNTLKAPIRIISGLSIIIDGYSKFDIIIISLIKFYIYSYYDRNTYS